jgi:hypothetical protein
MVAGLVFPKILRDKFHSFVDGAIFLGNSTGSAPAGTMTKPCWFSNGSLAGSYQGVPQISLYVGYWMRGMTRISMVMVRCPVTGRELSTGVEMDAATFERLPEIRAQIRCPACGRDHPWSTREAWLGNPAPSAPSLPWLLINNRFVAND